MAKLNSKKWKKSLFYEEKSLVGMTLSLDLRKDESWSDFEYETSQTLSSSPDNILNQT
jgi:hypothetical protein